jgi:hypothetical protein
VSSGVVINALADHVGDASPQVRQGGDARNRCADKMPQPGMPLVSIITTTYNAAECLPDLARSIREQTYGNIEWIVVDGASKDCTLEIIRQNEDVIEHWISEPDRGIYDAWNKGLELASGEWICFLGADDFLWSPEALESMAPALAAAYPGCRVVYGSLAVVNPGGQMLYLLGEPWAAVRRRFQSVMALPHPGLMHHQSLFGEHGKFDTSYRIAGDYELLLRELRTGDARHLDGVIVAGMTLGGVSTTPRASWTMLKEMRRAARANGQLLPGGAWLNAVVRYALRRLLWGIFGERVTRTMLDGGRWLLGKPAHWTKS